MTPRIPSARSVRRAVDLLAQLPPEALGQLAEALIDRLDAAEWPMIDREEEVDGCDAEDAIPPSHLPLGDEADAEPSLGWAAGRNASQPYPEAETSPDAERDDCDDEPDDDDMGSSEEEALFPAYQAGLRPALDGLVTIHRRTIPFVMVTSKAGRPTGVATMLARRFP